MSFRFAPFWWIECDRCGVSSTDGGEISAWASLKDAEMDAAEADWDLDGGNHLCYKCIPHPPDWDDEHYSAYAGESILNCSWCHWPTSLVSEGR